MKESQLLQNERKAERVLTEVVFDYDDLFKKALTRGVFNDDSQEAQTFDRATFGSLLYAIEERQDKKYNKKAEVQAILDSHLKDPKQSIAVQNEDAPDRMQYYNELMKHRSSKDFMVAVEKLMNDGVLKSYGVCELDKKVMFEFVPNLSYQPMMKEAQPFLEVVRNIVMLYDETQRGFDDLRCKLTSGESMGFLFQMIKPLLKTIIKKNIQKNMSYHCIESIFPYLMREYMVKLTRNKRAFDFYPFVIKMPQGLSFALTPESIAQEQSTEKAYKSHLQNLLEAYSLYHVTYHSIQ